MTTTSMTSHKDEMIELRRKGWTLRDVGDHFRISHERVRQVLEGDDPGREPGWMTRDQRAEREIAYRVAEYVTDSGPYPREHVRAVFEITEPQLARMVKNGWVPEAQLMMSARDTPNEYTTAGIAAGLRRVWEAYQADVPDPEGLSHGTYERYRSPEEASSALVVSRIGWSVMCDIAGVPAGVSRRPKSSYRSAWTDDEIVGWVADFLSYARNQGIRPTYAAFDTWQRDIEDAPSGSTVRNKMRDAGAPRWPDILAAAKEIAS